MDLVHVQMVIKQLNLASAPHKNYSQEFSF